MPNAVEIPEFPEDEENEFDYPLLQSQEIISENDQVIIGDIAVKTGSVWNAAKIACVLHALSLGNITYEEAIEKIEEMKPILFKRM